MLELFEMDGTDQAKPISEDETAKNPSDMSPSRSQAISDKKDDEFIVKPSSVSTYPEGTIQDKSPAKADEEKMARKDKSDVVSDEDEPFNKDKSDIVTDEDLSSEKANKSDIVTDDVSTEKPIKDESPNKDKAEVIEDIAKPSQTSCESPVYDPETLVLTCDELLESPIKRKPRLNRRGVQSSDSPSEELDVETPKPVEDIAGDPGSAAASALGSRRNIISLKSVKKCTSEITPPVTGRKIVLKRKASTACELEEKTKTKETSPKEPPKKKYKPITWP